MGITDLDKQRSNSDAEDGGVQKETSEGRSKPVSFRTIQTAFEYPRNRLNLKMQHFLFINYKHHCTLCKKFETLKVESLKGSGNDQNFGKYQGKVLEKG